MVTICPRPKARLRQKTDVNDNMQATLHGTTLIEQHPSIFFVVFVHLFVYYFFGKARTKKKCLWRQRRQVVKKEKKQRRAKRPFHGYEGQQIRATRRDATRRDAP